MSTDFDQSFLDFFWAFLHPDKYRESSGVRLSVVSFVLQKDATTILNAKKHYFPVPFNTIRTV